MAERVMETTFERFAAIVLGPLEVLWRPPVPPSDRERYRALCQLWHEDLGIFHAHQLDRAVVWLRSRHHRTTWPTIAEFREAISASSADEARRRGETYQRSGFRHVATDDPGAWKRGGRPEDVEKILRFGRLVRAGWRSHAAWREAFGGDFPTGWVRGKNGRGQLVWRHQMTRDEIDEYDRLLRMPPPKPVPGFKTAAE